MISPFKPLPITAQDFGDKTKIFQWWNSSNVLLKQDCQIVSGKSSKKQIFYGQADRKRWPRPPPTLRSAFLNPECVRILWVLAPKKNSPLKIFGGGAIYEKIPFFTNFHCHLQKNCQPAQFWCHRPSLWLVWTVILQSFQGYPKRWHGVNSEVMPNFCRKKRLF